MIADTSVELLVMRADWLEQDGEEAVARIRLSLYRNLAEINMQRLAQANGEIRLLTGQRTG